MMPMISERNAAEAIHAAKICAKDALAALDPAPAEPVAKAILALIDAADKASVELQKRQAAAS